MHTDEKVQKFLAILILLIVPAFVFKEYKNLSYNTPTNLVLKEASVINNEYTKEENKSFVVLIFSEETSSSIKTLESIFAQNYQDFRVVYIYREKSSKSYISAKNFIEENGLLSRIEFHKAIDLNSSTSSLFQIVHHCQDQEVIVHLDSSDSLIDENVLERINEQYKDPDVWLTYADFIEEKTQKKKGLKPVVNKSLRQFSTQNSPWMLAHLKSYYAGVLKQALPMAQQDLTDQIFMEDKALMLSLFKIAKWHVRFIPDALTVHDEQKKGS